MVVGRITISDAPVLETPISLHPTSETLIYPYFSKMIRGRHALPLKYIRWCNYNQWCNSISMEFTNPMLFIRSRVFLWQEGHTAHATKEEAGVEVLEILELYRRLYEKYMAVPVVKGKKSELEKLVGGLYTTSVEAFIPNTGRGVQGATSHCLGLNFAEIFGINFKDKKGDKAMVWQKFWGFSTKVIGVLMMVHGDDRGLVLPPKVSKVQVIVIPMPYEGAGAKELPNTCLNTVQTLLDMGIRAEADLRENYSTKQKCSHWEMKGVPLRIEIGLDDLGNKQVWTVRRDNGEKVDVPLAELADRVKVMLDNIQQTMFDLAKQKRDACTIVNKTWDEFIIALDQKKLILAPWCDDVGTCHFIRSIL
uniref:proline--tRNA ligase, cytoplasmic-like n=1 Tax=Erigeron canadensis TaxID=72917 RepID=UPI001CB9C643|nr:proline--tRNA ligase, cytoplasmic-like [Erigeron canadensis]